MKYKVLAKNQKGHGLLPMKQSEELESKKSDEQKLIELCNFIKNAFIIDGKVSLIKLKEPVKFNEVFIAEDSKRGNFIIAIKN